MPNRDAQSERRAALTTVDDVSKAVARVKGLESALPTWWSAPLESFAARAIVEPSASKRLVTDNAQGELSPLEIGIHALGSVELSEGGAGKKGGRGGGVADAAQGHEPQDSCPRLHR